MIRAPVAVVELIDVPLYDGMGWWDWLGWYPEVADGWQGL